MTPGLVIALAIAGGCLIGWVARGAWQSYRYRRLAGDVERALADRAGA